jgi:hypothetical protein
MIPENNPCKSNPLRVTQFNPFFNNLTDCHPHPATTGEESSFNQATNYYFIQHC